MDRWGLGYQELKKLRDDIIMVRLPGFGLDGPYRDHVGLAAVAMGITGMYHLWSYADGSEPAGPPVWVPDYLSAGLGGAALMAALRHRDTTGKGELVELSQVDATAFAMGPAFLDYLANGAKWEPKGNSSSNFAPQGVYRCSGDDAWCAISVGSNQEWHALCQVLGDTALGEDSRLSTLEGRLAHRDDIDCRIGEWAKAQTSHQAMDVLQRAGVPAGVVQSGEELFRDPHLRERGFMESLEGPETGSIEYPGSFIRLWDTPGQLDWWHTMGQDNRYVFEEILKMSSQELGELERSGVLS
jgi:crotonobetainyl-CoA:carnitine CoA-transferase CaiB-like acyl-CoA transferase